MSGYWIAPDDYAADPPTFSGAAHSVSGEPQESDRVEELRRVVEEVTGQPVPRAERRIGFL